MQSPTTDKASPKRTLEDLEKEEEEVLMDSQSLSEEQKRQCLQKAITPRCAGEAVEVKVLFGKQLAGKYPCSVQLTSRQGYELDFKTHDTDTPVVFAVMDISGSMRGDKWLKACEALLKYVGLIPASQPMYMCIIAYNFRAEVVLPPTLNPTVELVSELLDKVSPSGGTCFKPAMEAVMTMAKEWFEQKHPVVCAFFTDGDDGSALQMEMSTFKVYGARGFTNEIYEEWSTRDRFCVHSIGIGIQQPPMILQMLSTFGKQTGECLVINSDNIAKVMAALYATTMQVIPDCCTVTVSDTLRLPISILVGDHMLVNKVSFFVDANAPVKIQIAIGNQPPFFTYTVDDPSLGELVEEGQTELTASAFSFLCPNLVRETAPAIQALNFEDALEKVTHALQYLRTVSEQLPQQDVQLERSQIQLRELLESIQEQSDNVRSDSCATTNAALSRIQSAAFADSRSLSGAPSLIPTEGRQMSTFARSLSDAV